MSKPVVLAAVAQKGGVGKTTTCYSVAHTAAKMGAKVVLIDYDSQASLSTSLIDLETIAAGIDSYSFVKSKDKFEPLEIKDNLYLIPASLDLLKLDQEDFESYFTLRERIGSELQDFDLIVIDTAGTLKTTLTAALVAADYMYSPIELNSYSIKSYSAIGELFKNVKRRFNNDLSFAGFLPNRIHGIREIDGRIQPYNRDERKVFQEITKNENGQNNIIYLLEELAGVRRAVQVDNDSDAGDTGAAITHLEKASAEIFKRIGLEFKK